MNKFLNYLYQNIRIMSIKGILNSFIYHVPIKKLTKTDILYLCHDNSRPILLNNKFYSPLIDSIIIKLNSLSNITLALPFSKYSGSKTFGNTVNLNLYVIIALIKRVFYFKSIFLSDINKDPLIIFYSRLLLKLDVKIIIGIQPSTEICIAANKNNIDVFDVQHGIITSSEEGSYYSLNKRKLFHDLGKPNFILCKNINSFNKILNSKIDIKPIMIGNLNRFFYQNIYKNNSNRILFENNNRTILFTLQPYLACDEEFKENNKFEGVFFPKVVLNFILNSEFNFILKLHPAQIQKATTFRKHIKAFDKLFSTRNNVEYIICNQKPLDYSMSISDLHITYNSATAFEAMDYNLTTILLDTDKIRLQDYFGDLLESNYMLIDPYLEQNIEKLFQKLNYEDDNCMKYFDEFSSFIFKKFKR